jgi:hypothetical protein
MGGRRHPTDWERQREQLSAYIDGELSAAERAELERHIAGCAECQEALGELRQVHDLLAALPAPKARSFALPLDTRQDARPPVRLLEQARPPQPALRGARLTQWAGALAATIGLFLLLGGVVTGLLGSNGNLHDASSGGARPSLTGAQSQTPVATAPDQRTPDFNSTQQPQVSNGATPSATPTTGNKDVFTTVTHPEPGFPILPVTGAGLLVLGASLYVAGRSRRRREIADVPRG